MAKVITSKDGKGLWNQPHPEKDQREIAKDA